MRGLSAVVGVVFLLLAFPFGLNAQEIDPRDGASRAGEREVGVPEFPYDPKARGEARRACVVECISQRRHCERSTETDARDCEVGFLLCTRSCAERRSGPGDP